MKGFAFLLLSIFFIGLVSSSAIWTTKTDCTIQDANEYVVSEDVFIRGDGFDEGEYSWEIVGQPGQASCSPGEVVASGTYTVDSSGYFCFEAYEVLDGDCGVYKAKFDRRSDNYHVSVVPMVPEFSTIVGIMTAFGALGLFAFIRRD